MLHLYYLMCLSPGVYVCGVVHSKSFLVQHCKKLTLYHRGSRLVPSPYFLSNFHCKFGTGYGCAAGYGSQQCIQCHCWSCVHLLVCVTCPVSACVLVCWVRVCWGAGVLVCLCAQCLCAGCRCAGVQVCLCACVLSAQCLCAGCGCAGVQVCLCACVLHGVRVCWLRP